MRGQRIASSSLPSSVERIRSRRVRLIGPPLLAHGAGWRSRRGTAELAARIMRAPARAAARRSLASRAPARPAWPAAASHAMHHEEELLRPFGAARPSSAASSLGDARDLGMAGVLLVVALLPADLAVDRQDRRGDLGEVVDALRADRQAARAPPPGRWRTRRPRRAPATRPARHCAIACEPASGVAAWSSSSASLRSRRASVRNEWTHASSAFDAAVPRGAVRGGDRLRRSAARPSRRAAGCTPARGGTAGRCVAPATMVRRGGCARAGARAAARCGCSPALSALVDGDRVAR